MRSLRRAADVTSNDSTVTSLLAGTNLFYGNRCGDCADSVLASSLAPCKVIPSGPEMGAPFGAPHRKRSFLNETSTVDVAAPDR